jgi:amidase
MFATPTTAEIVEIATSLGIHLTPEEAEVFQATAVDQLEDIDDFVQSRLVEELKPPLLYPERAPGYRPSAAEDKFNAWVWKCRIGGRDEGLLAGKTVSFKDHVAVAGIPCSYGAHALEGYIPDYDATIVTRVLAAGATVVGKNVMNGLSGGKSLGGSLGDYWAPLNPHNPGHLTGGSSSGSGAALAAAEVDISFGGDQGGSIRIPAAYCGVLGLKPTFALVSHMGLAFGSEQSVDHTGPMARTVEDLAAALEATAGYDGFDQRQTRDVPAHLDVMTGLTAGVKGLRIGVVEEGFSEPIDVEVRDGVMEAVDVLAKAGAEVTKLSIPEHLSVQQAATVLGPEGSKSVRMAGIFGAWAKTYYPTSAIVAVDQMWASHSDMLSPRTKFNFVLAELSRRNFHGAAYAKAHNVRPAYVKAYDSALAEVDVLAMPTCVTLPPPVDEVRGHQAAVLDQLARINGGVNQMVRNTRPFNYTGHPALSVPCGKSGGLPFSLQLIGRFFDDALLCRVAHAYQESVDWEDLIAVGH